MPRSSQLHKLAQILDGKEVFENHQWDYLREMSKMTADFSQHLHNAPAYRDIDGYADMDDDLSNYGGQGSMELFPYETKIVGNSYRKSQQQSTLRNKNKGNRVLIVPEPGNKHDRAALAVLVARSLSSNSFVWTHVGYVPKQQAADLASVWPRYRGRLLVGEGRITGTPSLDNNPAILLEGSFRSYWEK